MRTDLYKTSHRLSFTGMPSLYNRIRMFNIICSLMEQCYVYFLNFFFYETFVRFMQSMAAILPFILNAICTLIGL